MQIQSFEFILYVHDQRLSAAFYAAVLGIKPSLDVPGMTEFTLGATLKLGLMPEKGIAKIISGNLPHPENGTGIPRCELYLKVVDLEAVFAHALACGAQLVDPVKPRDWGDRAGYLADPDGHVIALAEDAFR